LDLSIGQAARHYNATQLAGALQEARARLKSLVNNLTDAQWNVPQQPGINPVAWEIGHVAWFAEWWTRRGPHAVDAAGHTVAQQPPVHAGPDALFDSSRIAHADRWKATLPARAAVLDVLDAQLNESLAVLANCSADDAALYFHRLALFHEDMHNEALIWMRAVLAYPAPAQLAPPRALAPAGTREISAHQAVIGQLEPAGGFFFDNEKWARTVDVPAFEIDHAPVNNAQFLRFVLAGGYRNSAYWPGAAGHWLRKSPQQHPARWRLHNGAWQQQWFDTWIAVEEDAPVMHINAYEAQAYCAWAGRRLPHAVEWEAAARAGAIAWGNSVWEWTADEFAPYPGFSADPYKDYSAPWFHTHRELRGGSFATDARMHHVQYRNFFQPHRNDVFAGFRTCSKD
jgi:gamma-glutamyl hercynylcysteine S-oxide synthase